MYVLCSGKTEHFMIVLVHSGCYNKNLIDWVVYKQQIYFSRYQMLEVRSYRQVGVWCSSIPWFIYTVSLSRVAAEGIREHSQISFRKSVSPIHYDPALMTLKENENVGCSVMSYSLWTVTTDCSPPGSSVHGILRARVLESTAIPCFRGSFQPRDQTWVFCIASRFFTI